MSYGWSVFHDFHSKSTTTYGCSGIHIGSASKYRAVEFPVLLSMVGTESGTVLGMPGQDDPRGETCLLEKRSAGWTKFLGLQNSFPYHTHDHILVPIFADMG